MATIQVAVDIFAEIVFGLRVCSHEPANFFSRPCALHCHLEYYRKTKLHKPRKPKGFLCNQKPDIISAMRKLPGVSNNEQYAQMIKLITDPAFSTYARDILTADSVAVSQYTCMRVAGYIVGQNLQYDLYCRLYELMDICNYPIEYISLWKFGENILPYINTMLIISKEPTSYLHLIPTVLMQNIIVPMVWTKDHPNIVPAITFTIEQTADGVRWVEIHNDSSVHLSYSPSKRQAIE